jgi:predicted Zn-dependent peptidase
VRKTATGAGEAATAARKRASAARRQALEKAPYGSAWLALGEHLMPAGSPLAGAVPASPLLPLQSVCIAEPGTESAAWQASLRVTVTVSGAGDRAALATEAERAFADALTTRAGASPLAHEERVDLIEPVPSPRVLFGWLAPTPGEADRAALRLAVLALAHEQLGRVARALLAETHVAVRVRGLLDVGNTASVLAIEATPSVLHDVTIVERELDRALEGLFTRGLTEAELQSAKEQLRARLQAARSRAGTTGEPREAALAKITRAAESADAVTGEELRAFVEKVLAKNRRVVVTTSPRK